ncbi:MAG: redoxin domain-containing protein [Bacteroidales bacterium]|nr:redoxin domain-containing protein [Bacteroidales bacterium]
MAQRNITIKGTAANALGKRVELYGISDQISKHEVLLDTFRVGEDSRFDLRCWSNYPMMVTLQIENFSQSFYVEPGKDYSVEIPTFKWDVDETRNVFLEPETLPIIFKNIPPNDINLQIDSIDRVIARFIEQNFFYFDFKYKPSTQYFDSLVKTVNRLCPDTTNDFVVRYKIYQLAQLRYTMHLDTRKNLINRYIRNHPILYHDENYMSLFAELYANSISKGTKEIPVHRLAHWVYNLDLDTYIDSIGMDPLLRHEQIRELAALQALKESYYNFRYYDASMVVKMIEKLASRTKFPEHKKIAANILASFHLRDAENTEEISFVLLDVDKNPVDLAEKKGKWLYLAFIRVDDPFSISEMETMAHFKDQVYNDSVEFITIVCDREFQKMFHFLKNSRHSKNYDWTWLHYNGNYDLLRHFQITAYPWFVLINPQGNIHYDITPAPSTGFLPNAPWLNKDYNDTPQRELFRY